MREIPGLPYNLAKELSDSVYSRETFGGWIASAQGWPQFQIDSRLLRVQGLLYIPGQQTVSASKSAPEMKIDRQSPYLCNSEIFNHHPGHVEPDNGPDSDLCRPTV